MSGPVRVDEPQRFPRARAGSRRGRAPLSASQRASASHIVHSIEYGTLSDESDTGTPASRSLRIGIARSPISCRLNRSLAMCMKLGVTVTMTPSFFMRAIWSSVASMTWTITQRRSWIGTTSLMASLGPQHPFELGSR